MAVWPQGSFMATLILEIGAGLLILSVASVGYYVVLCRREEAERRNRLRKVFGYDGKTQDTGWVERLRKTVTQVGSRSMRSGARAWSDQEFRSLLQQAGWYRFDSQALYYGLQVLVPVAAALLATVPGLLVGHTGPRLIGGALTAGLAGFLFPRYLLRALARRRQRRIAEEVPVFVHLLRMLFESGLGLEQTLQILHGDARAALPTLHGELTRVTRRISSGIDRAEALDDMARALDVDILTDTVSILKQVARLGGNVRKSFIELSRLIENRVRAELQEKVNQLSAKMTLVMVLFLFPALLIFLAGPGFIALVGGLTNVSG